MDKIETWAKEEKEKELEEIVKSMHKIGMSEKEIHEYLCKEATRYLLELGYNENR